MTKRILPLLALMFAAVGCADFSAFHKWREERDVIEKVGFLAHTDISWPKSAEALKRALAFFREEGVKKVVFIGDPTEKGYQNQREVFDAVWKNNCGSMERVIAEDPYAWEGIDWTANARYPLTDLMCVQPLDGKTINVGSMHGIEISSVFQKQDQKTVARQKLSAQGLLVLRFKDRLTVRRMDFSGKVAAEVGPCWEVGSSGLIHVFEGKKAPEFWSDTRISVVKGYDKVGNVVYTVRWPPVLAKHTGERAFSYEVSVGKKVLRQVQSCGFFLPEEEDGASVACMIAEKELQGAEPRFGVTPISSMGLAGKTVYSP